jgi:cytochrome c553
MPRSDLDARMVGPLAFVLLAACVHGTVSVPPRRLGDAMIEVAMRFERAGRAVLANRWGLASYDLTELGEVFDDDLIASKWMGNAEVARLAHRFDADALLPLRDAVRAKDGAASEAAFAAAATACNACHRAAGMAFIEIPSTLGSSVPAIETR